MNNLVLRVNIVMCGVNYSFLLFPPSPSPALFIIFFLEPELSWTHLTLPRCLFWKSRPFCVFSDSGMVLWNLSLFPCKGSLGWKSNCSQFSTARHTQTEIEGFGTKHGCEWVSEWVSERERECVCVMGRQRKENNCVFSCGGGSGGENSCWSESKWAAEKCVTLCVGQSQRVPYTD